MRPTANHAAMSAPAAEAVEWFVTLQSSPVSHEQRTAFVDWLRRSPVHVAEFLQLTALQGDLERLPQLQAIDVSELIAEASASGLGENIVNLTHHPAGAWQSRSGRGSLHGRNRRWYGSAVLAAVAATVVGIGLLGFAPIRALLSTERYDTDVGEQRSLTLADGSEVRLNVRSNLWANVTASVREVRLKEGEALFHVAKDPLHPFRVRTPQAIIEAKGTQFNVHVNDSGTVVTLLEGKVDVQPSGSSAVIPLSPGEQVKVAPDSTAHPEPRTADLKTVTAWTERRLVFEDKPLADVIAEFNRYSRQPFVVDDPQLGNIRITASFESGSVQTFANSLAAAGALEVTHQPNGIWRIARKTGSIEAGRKIRP